MKTNGYYTKGAFVLLTLLATAFGLLLSCSGGAGGGSSVTAPALSVIYDANGGAGSVPVDKNEYAKGDSITVLGNDGVLTKSGYIFTGWSISNKGSGTRYNEENTFLIGAESVVLYAVWQSDASQTQDGGGSSDPAGTLPGSADNSGAADSVAYYNLTYDGNGNTGGSVPVDSANYVSGSSVTVRANTGSLTKIGYTFVGWNTSASGGGSSYAPASSLVMGSSNLTLFAQWTAEAVYTVSYNGNSSDSGSAPAAPAGYRNNQRVSVLNNTGNFKKSGYLFDGWNSATDGGGTSYGAGSEFAIAGADVILYVKWAPAFTVTYDANGSTGGDVPVDSGAYRIGAVVTVAGNTGSLEKSGYTFAGWSVDAGGSGDSYTGGSHFQMGSGNVTIYAKWTQNPTYRIIYNGNLSDGGTVPVDADSYEQGTPVPVLSKETMTRTGYTFTGWNTAQNGLGNNYAAGSTITVGTANIELFAVWTLIPTYSVIYKSGYTGGPVDVVDIDVYEAGDEVIVLDNEAFSSPFTRPGYAFTGWKDASGTDYAADDTFVMGSADKTFTAQWSAAAVYSVTYNGNGNTGGSVPIEGASFVQGAEVSVDGNTGNLVKSGFVFAGWNTASDGSGETYEENDTFTMGTSDVTLYVRWASAFTVNYNGNGSTGGSVPVDSNNYTPTQIVTVLGNSGSLVKSGATFTGWNTAADGTGISYTQESMFVMSNYSITLYAQWTATVIATYSVSYNGNGNTSGSAPVDTTAYEEAQSFNILGNTGTLVKSGATFTGWNTQSDGSGTSYAPGQSADIGAADVTLYAKWSTNPTYMVTYNSNGSSSGTVPVDSNRYETSQIVTVTANTGNLAQAGYLFTGWNTQADGSGVTYNNGSTFAMASADMTLYANWSPAYHVLYDGNGSSGGTVPVDPLYYLAGSEVTVLGNSGALVKSGSTFTGWNTMANGSGDTYTQDQLLTLSGNITLYANWETGSTYTVTYDGNGNTGGSIPVDSTYYVDGQSVTALSNTGLLAKTGYAFVGWNTQSDGLGSFYAPGNSFIMGTANVTLYGKWAVSRKFYAISGSSDGSVLFAAAYSGTVWRSDDYGETWSQMSGNKKWFALASSSDGTRVAAVPYAKNMYINIAGTPSWTWSTVGSVKVATFNSIASSADGTKLAAAAYNGYIVTYDSAATPNPTWTQHTSDPARLWRGIASSSDGTKLAAVVAGGQIYTSTDAGVTWTARADARNWFAIASSSDGINLAAAVTNGQIYTSSDSGETWTARASSRAWRSIASSSDGTKLAAAVAGGQIYTSSDSGVTWTARASVQNWYSVTSSESGEFLAAAVCNGTVYTSDDYGLTWNARSVE